MGILSHDGEMIALTDLLGKKRHFSSSQIKDIQLAPVSIMPPGIDQVLSREQLADLIAFLESLTDESVLYDERFSDPFLN